MNKRTHSIFLLTLALASLMSTGTLSMGAPAGAISAGQQPAPVTPGTAQPAPGTTQPAVPGVVGNNPAQVYTGVATNSAASEKGTVINGILVYKGDKTNMNVQPPDTFPGTVTNPFPGTVTNPFPGTVSNAFPGRVNNRMRGGTNALGQALSNGVPGAVGNAGQFRGSDGVAYYRTPNGVLYYKGPDEKFHPMPKNSLLSQTNSSTSPLPGAVAAPAVPQK